MKNIQIKLLIILAIILIYPHLVFSQDSMTNELSYEVYRIYPYITITKDKLSEAYTISDFKHEANDLNLDYKPSWVKEYISVEILTNYKGRILKAVSENDTLSQEQKHMMKMADAGSDISVKVKYLPNNTLKHNDPKELDFTFTVDPESEAKFPGGLQQLKKYLKENAIDKIPRTSFKNYDLLAVKFTIAEDGEIINAHVFGSEYQVSKNRKTENLLLEVIRNMPCWKPAEYSDGTKVKQDFVLAVGNLGNCMVHLLNIQRD